MPNDFWTMTAIAGVDGFRVSGLSNAALPIPLSLEDGIQDAEGGADRLSLRLRGTGRFDVAQQTAMTFTLAVEQAMLRDASAGTPPAGPSGQQQMPRARVLQSTWATNSGVVAQTDLSWRDMVYLVAGARLEQTVGATANPQNASMPMLGASVVRDVGEATLKARIGYGRGIRPAQTLMRGASWAGRAAVDSRSELSPESQAGVEFGTDLVWGKLLSLHVTRFDQRASGLIQPVAAQVVLNQARPGQQRPDTTRPSRIGYVLENVGAIDNRGWEFEANGKWRSLSIIGWWSIVDSRVSRVSPSYRGDLRAGDRPLEVPAQTMSLSVNWSAGRLQAASTIARASDWIAYDRIRIATVLATRENTPSDLTGAQLRRFWREYPGVTQLRASLGLRVSGRTSLQLGGENLLDLQRGAPDNATIVTGRTVTIGARTSF